MKRSVLRIAVVLLALLVLFILFVQPVVLIAPITLILVGWRPSMMRMWGAWHPSLSGILVFLFATVVLLAGSHSFLSWLYASLRKRDESRWPAAWRWKWTLCGFAMLACALVAICSLVLTTHQIYWISKSPDPLFADPLKTDLGVYGVAKELQMKADELQWDSVRTHEAFLQNDLYSRSARSEDLPAETIRPVWIEKDNQTLRAIVLIQRRTLFHARAWAAALQPGTNYVVNSDELPRLLASFGIGITGQGFSQGTPARP